MADNKDFVDLLENIKIDFVSQQAALGIRASGRSADSLQVVNSSGGPALMGSNYWAFLFEGTGRGPGRMPPPDEIESWIFDKGISFEGTIQQAAFGIAKHIGEQGTSIYNGSPGIPLDEIVKVNLEESASNIAKKQVDKILEPFRK